MENEVQVYNSEIKTGQEVHIVDSSQRSIRSFFKPVACKPHRSIEGGCSRTDATVGQSLSHKENSSVKGTAAEDNIDVSIKSKRRKRTIEIERIDISSTSIDSMEEEKDLLEQGKFICKGKHKKKSIRNGEQKSEVVLINEREKEEYRNPEILEDQKIDERKLEMKFALEVKKDTDFSINVTLDDDDKMKAGKKSRRKKYKIDNKGQDEETVTRKKNFEVEHKRKMMIEEEKEKTAVIVEKDFEFIGNEVEVVKETIEIRKSESKENRKAVSDEEGRESKLADEPDKAIGKRRKEKRKKKNCDTINASDCHGMKETKEKGMKRGNIKSGNEAIVEATSVGDDNAEFIKKSSMAKQAHMKRKSDRKKDNLPLEGHNPVKSSEEKSPLNEEKLLANTVIKNNEKSEDKKAVKAGKKNYSQIDKRKVLGNIKEKNEGENVEEMQQDIKLEEIVKEESVLHSAKKKKSKKAKNVASTSSDFGSSHLEAGANWSVVCSEKDSDDESQTLNRRSRRQRMRAVNYADEFFSVDDDDKDFNPQARKPRRSQVDRKSVEQKSNGENCNKKRMKSRQVNENGRKQGSEEESIVHCKKGPSVPVVEDSDVNLKNKKTLDEKSQESIQADSKNIDLSAGTCLQTNFLAKFAKQMIVKSEEIVVIKQQTALPCINHTLQITVQEKEWYQKFVIEVEHRNEKSIKMNDVADYRMIPPFVTKGADWAFLTNFPQANNRISGKSTHFVPLNIALAELSEMDLLVPLLKQLKVYVDCQMNVLKQCLAKVEVPKSNLKTIWEKEEKWVKSEVPSIQLVDNEPAKPTIDIRSMFTNAKSKAPRVPKPREDEATLLEEKRVRVPKRGENDMADGVKVKRNAKKKSRKRRSREEKEDDGKDKIVTLDSSVEILSKDEESLKSANTIQQSFTKISKERRHPKRKTVNIDDEENYRSEQEELVPFRRTSSRRAASKNEVTVDESFVNVDEEPNQVASRKSRRRRRRNADEAKVSDRAVNEEAQKEDRDIAEDYSARKKRKRKKRRARAGRGDDGSNASNDITEPDSSESHTSPCHSKKRTKKSGKKVKDENLLVSNEEILENQVSNPAQHDIRKLFGSARHSVKGKERLEGKIEAKTTEQCESNGPSNDVVLPEVLCSPIDEAKELSCILDDKEEVVLIEQKPSVDIRCFFRKRSMKESEACIADVAQMNASSVDVEEEKSQKEILLQKEVSERHFFDGKQKIAESLESECDKKEIDIPADRKKEVGLSEEKFRSSCREIEDVKQGETNNVIVSKDNRAKEDGARESAEDAEQRKVIVLPSGNDHMSETPRAVGAMKGIMSYFKPYVKKLKGRGSPGLDLSCTGLTSKSSTTEQLEINDPDPTNGDIVKKYLSGGGQNERYYEKVTPLNEELQTRSCVEKQDNVDVSLGKEAELGRKLEISSEETPEIGEDGVLIDNIECDRHSETEDQNLEESVETRTSKIYFSPAGTYARGKRKRVTASVVESHTEKETLGECVEAKSESEMKLSKAKRVKINEDGEAKDISVINSGVICKNLNIELESLDLGIENRHVKVNLKRNGELENYKESTNEGRLDLEAMNFTNVCKDVDANVVENSTAETRTMEHRTSNEVISDNEDGIVPKNNSHSSPFVAVTELCSSASSSSNEEIDNNVEAICGSKDDVDIEIPCDTEDGNVDCYELEDNASNGESENDMMSNVGVSSREGKRDSYDVSSTETELLPSDTKFSDNSENATLNQGTERDEPVEVVGVPLNASSQPNHGQDCSVRPKRKRKASSFTHEDELLEQTGRRRSSRVKEKEEQRLEEERKIKEELERVSRESLVQKSPEAKRRKSRKIVEDARKATSHNGNTGGKASEMGESRTKDFNENVDMPMHDSASETKTENSAQKEEIKVVEIPQIDEDYINSSLLWTEKYAPSSHDNVIGNTFQVKEIFEWLSVWKEKHERFVMKFITGDSQKLQGRADCSSDFDDSSDDEDDESIANTFVIIGKVGCGSTATVYACAQELGYKVLEMHPSNFRSGKQIQSLLGEATQSHQVKRKFHGAGGDNSNATIDETPGVKNISSYFGGKLLGGKSPGIEQNRDYLMLLEKNNAEDSGCGKDANPDFIGGEMSLILFEQADIVFDEQDKGFWFGLNELRRQAKRPILITGNDSSLATKLDGESFEVTTMDFVEEKLIVDHLQVLCLAEHVRPSKLLIEKIVRDCNNDIRKSMLKLQFVCEQWMKPCYNAMDRVIKDSSIVDLTYDLNGKESIDDANPVQDSRNRGYERADLQADEADPISLVPVDESGIPEEVDHKEQVVPSIVTEVAPCVAQVQGISSRGPKMQDLEPKAAHIQNSIQHELKDLKGMEIDGREVDIPRDGCEGRFALGELKSEMSTSEFKTADEDANSVEKKESKHEVVPIVMEEGPRKEEILEEVPMIAVVEDDGSFNWGDQNCFYDMKKIDKYSLCQLNPNLSQEEKDILISSSHMPRTLEMMSTSADALSFMDTLCDTWPQILASPCAHRQGWWHAKILDGITDEERLSEDSKRRDNVLEELYKSTANAFRCVHSDILGEYDIESSSLSTRESDITLETLRALEDCFPQSVRTDHRSFCMDTYSSLLNICKSEETRKTSEFGRRSRRFLHYLDNIGLHLDSDFRRQLLQTSLVEDSNLTCK